MIYRSIIVVIIFEKYISYLRGTFDQILDSIGYDFDELLGATKIEDFFWS